MATIIHVGFLWRRFFIIGLVAALGAAVLGATSQASVIDGYSAARHDRFLSGGYAGSPVDNTAFFLDGYDFSGIGRAAGNQPLTMISPIHFVAARHFVPSGSVTFVNQSGVIKNYTVASTTAVVDPSFAATTTDLVVGTLTAAIPASDEIAFYPTFSYSSLSEFDNAELLVYGRQNRVGRNELDGDERLLSGSASNFNNVTVSGRIGLTATYDYSPATGFSPDESKLEAGDSGSPTFIRYGSQLGLAGIHWAIGAFDDGVQANFDTFIPYYQPQIDALMAGSGYSIQTVSILIPEPTSLALVFMIGISCLSSRLPRRSTFRPRA